MGTFNGRFEREGSFPLLFPLCQTGGNQNGLKGLPAVEGKSLFSIPCLARCSRAILVLEECRHVARIAFERATNDERPESRSKWRRY